MSDVTQNPPKGLGFLHITPKWGWFVALGIVLILVGFFALVDVVAFTIASVIFIGAMMLVGGIFQIIHAFMTKTWGSFALNLLMGIIYVIGGFLIMDEPVQGSLVITLFLIAALVVGGVVRMFVAFQHREMDGWGLMAVSGLISLILAAMLFMSFPGSGLWVLGTLIAVELLIQGVTWLQFGISLRRLGRTHATTT
jgi:uncharacterized membrane protein HdeD (DUF308 family)